MKESMKKVPFKKWNKFDKSVFSLAIGFMAFSAVMTALYIKEKDTKHVLFHGACTVINAVCAKKIKKDAHDEVLRIYDRKYNEALCKD